jgi:hypothetical protein
MVVPMFVGLFKFLVQNFRMVNPKPSVGASESDYLVDNVHLVDGDLWASELLDDQLTSGFELILTERLLFLLPPEVLLNCLISLHGSEVILLNYIVLPP